jgi:hypothetical protein
LGCKGNPRENIFIYYCPKPEANKQLPFVRNERWKLYGNNRLFEVANDVLEKKPVTGPSSKRIRKQFQAAFDQLPGEGQKLMKFEYGNSRDDAALVAELVNSFGTALV